MSHRSSLFIDKLNITYDIRRELHSQVLLMAEGLETEERWTRIHRSRLLNNYRCAYAFDLGLGECLTVQMHPWTAHDSSAQRSSRGRRFMRLEWNPRRAKQVDASYWLRFSELLGELIPGFADENLLENAYVTRMDLGFDVRGQHVDSLQVFSLLRRAASGHYVHGPTGKRNAIEIGKPEGDRYLRIYDKWLQSNITQPQSTPRHGSHPRLLRRQRSWTRIELQLRDVGRFARLGCIRNPFAGYTIRAIERIANTQIEYVEEWFLDSCRQRGLHAALSLIPKQRTRTKYVNLVREAESPSWWNADQIWADLPAALTAAF